MQAALRHRHRIVNHKKIIRFVREHATHPPLRRRFVATTKSDHDEPVFSDRSKDREIDGPNQLWVAGPSYIAIAVGSVYLAVVIDAWSHRARLCNQSLDRCATRHRSTRSGHPVATPAAGVCAPV